MRRVVTLLWVVSAVLPGQQPPLPGDPGAAVKASQPVASRALQTLRKLVTEANYKSMGFQSLDEVGRATLGEPIVAYYIRLDRLRQFRADADPVQLLNGGDRVIYPVLVGEQARSSIEVTQSSKGWSAGAFGGANFAQLLHRFRGEGARAANQPVASFIEVSVLALRTHFLARRAESGLVLTPLLNDPQGRWRAGVPLAARDVFAQLVKDANAYNGLPM